MTDHLMFKIKTDEVAPVADEKIKKLIDEKRDDLLNPKTYKKAAEDLLSSYIAYSSVCCCVLATGDLDKWNHMQDVFGSNQESILRAFECLIRR